MAAPVDVFISYAARDQDLRDELETHLAPLKRDGQVRSWHAGLVAAGEEPQRQVAERFRTAQVVVLLVSADYIAGDTWEREMEPALARARSRSAVVIPVLVRPHAGGRAPFAGLSALPSNRVAVTAWTDRDAAWADVAMGIRQAVEKLGGGMAALAQRIRPPVPRIQDARVRQLAAELDDAMERRKELLLLGAGTSAVDQEIIDLRRKLREGGRLRAGDVLSNRYSLLEQLGRGGFATVWSAFDRERQENVAVKVLHPELAKDPVRFERFFRGARVMARLGHEAVVRVLCEQGEDGGWLYFVMELLAGGDLQRAVVKGTLAKASAVLLRVGEALAEAHARGIVHRDVKPANVLLDLAGAPRLTDFDLVAVGDTTGGTRTGALGSWLYTAPEQMHDARKADARADVYGLGMTLLFCLYGGQLPPSVTRKPEKVIAGLGCSVAMKAVITKAIETEPVDRFADAGAFCEALREAERRPVQDTVAQEFGEDSFGFFMSFKVGQVVQRLRWVPAGVFVMGSPEDEAGRDHDEVEHEVTLGEGYWMAETPCSQALWEAVMGYNPSLFKSPYRPVEKVSWEDCQHFLERLNGMVPGLGARLPTEAEWERACRAETTGATWVGDLDILGERNAPVLDAIAWYGGNSGQGFDLADGWDSSAWKEKQYGHMEAGTRLVAQKKPNPLGLYDTLGNVWEWCEDWYGPYDEAPGIDPRGPSTGLKRVIRGGAGGSRARRIRAAFRGARDPSRCYGYLGFRLARDQGGQAKGARGS